MANPEVKKTVERLEIEVAGKKIAVSKNVYFCARDFVSEKNTQIDSIAITHVDSKKSFVSPGGWQSWSPSYEVAPGKKLDSLKCRFIPQWNAYLQVPGEKYIRSKNVVMAQFVSYLREGDKYFVMASTGKVKSNDVLPPVYYEIYRKEQSAKVFVCDEGKDWKKEEKIAEVCTFECDSWFDAKEAISFLFKNNRFDDLTFLGEIPGGWESWYNHYAEIDSALIMDDLEALASTENLVSVSYIQKNKPCVFQVDDGWEKGLGNWEVNEKFPEGLKSVTQKIEDKNMIPGLWIAPFIVDIRTPICEQHPDWVLRDNSGKLIPAGYNPAWGDGGTFYALDLSNDEVLEHLDKVVDRAINQWGFRYIKLDFLYGGMLYGKHKKGGSSYQWFSRAISRLTSRKSTEDGKPVAYLGCGTPMELSFNDLPLSRIGCDTYEHWENKLPKLIGWNGRNSAYLNLKDSIGHAMWNKSIFFNDPDVIFVRNENCSLTSEEKKLIAQVAFMFGNQIMYSDDPASCTSEEEIRLTKEILSLKEKYEGEEFSVVSEGKDSFRIESKSGKFAGTIGLGKKHFIEISENK